MGLQKITAADMEKIAGGTLDDLYAAGLEMCKKYGVADEDWEALFDVISDDDRRLLVDELNKPEKA